MKPRAGDWVEVRSKQEILATLDKSARLDGLPFMPQMFQYCGERFQVYKRAHKTCDTVGGHSDGRRLQNGIHLDHRCDGQAYGGCQAGCLIFWKEAWLKPIDGGDAGTPALVSADDERIDEVPNDTRCTMEDVLRGTCAENQAEGEEKRYICQATELLNFTAPLKWWDARQYVEDYTSGNASLDRIFGGFLYFVYLYGTLANRGRLGVGVPARWLYDRIQYLRGGIPFPRRRGLLKSSQDAPTSDLNLQPGDLVRVKPYGEILKTINSISRNRGLLFDAEMVPFCRGTYRVRARVNAFIDETTGKMKHLKTPAVILDGVYCQSKFSEKRLFCPRSIFPWWREVWLERAPDVEKDHE